MLKIKLTMIILVATLLQGCVTAAVASLISGATIVNDKRSLGKLIDDQTIELSAYAALRKNKGIADNTHIVVTSVNGSVLIVGQAANTHLKELVAKTISELNSVEQIHNQIRVSNNISLTTRSNDVWLTSKVKMALFNSDKVEAINIKVVTENAEVFLMGLLNEEKAKEAVEVARNVSGVNRVFKAFEYVDIE